MPRLSFLSKEKLCFTPLDISFLEQPTYNRTEMEREYEKYIEEEEDDISFDEYLDTCLMDLDGDPEYIAVNNMYTAFNCIQLEISKRKVRSRLGLEKLRKKVAEVSIGIYDNEDMCIYTDDKELREKLISIISRYQG